MNRIKMIAAALLLLACALPAFAQPVTLDTKWNQKTFSISTTGVTAITIDVAGFGSAGYNLPGSTRILNGLDGTTYGANVITASSDTNVVGFSYSALVVGGTASMVLTQTIKTPPARGSANATSAAFNSPYPGANNFTVPLISTSSTITLPASVAVSNRFSAQTTNPILTFSSLTAGATLYVSVDFGIPKVQ